MNWRGLFAPLLRSSLRGHELMSALGHRWEALLEELDLPPHTFVELLKSDSLAPHFHYRHFTRPKKSGGCRDIAEPDANLKRIQQEIIRVFFQTESAHEAATAYRKKRSVADHVRAHTGAEIIVTADVQDFFPTTHTHRVRQWWNERVADGPARLLTLLTTYQGGLPQGAPTSPDLSNYVNRELDERLQARTAATGGRYTRYCDDLVFSWRWGAEPPSDFEGGVRATFHEFGYTLHPQKGWCLHHRRDEPEITGVILSKNGRLRLPSRFAQKMRALADSDDPRDAQRLAGYRGYEAMVTGRKVVRGDTH